MYLETSSRKSRTQAIIIYLYFVNIYFNFLGINEKVI